MKAAIKTLLMIEVAVCFAPASLILALGVMMVPTQIWFLFRDQGEDPVWGPLGLIVLVIGGIAGNIAVLNLLLRILSPPSHFLPRGWTLLGTLAGAAALTPYTFGPVDSGWWRLVGWMPLLCTLHLIYLGRRFMFGSDAGQNSSRRVV
jgi:hypothetical protein